MRQPGVGVGGDHRHLVGQLACGEVGEGDGLQHRAEVRPDGDPGIAEGRGGAGVLHLLGPLPAYVRDRALDRPDHVGKRDLLWRPGQPVAPFRAALALHEPGVLEVEQDALEELKRDLLSLGDQIALLRYSAWRRRELRSRAQRVVHLRRDPHRS